VATTPQPPTATRVLPRDEADQPSFHLYRPSSSSGSGTTRADDPE